MDDLQRTIDLQKTKKTATDLKIVGQNSEEKKPKRQSKITQKQVIELSNSETNLGLEKYDQLSIQQMKDLILVTQGKIKVI